MPAAAPAEVTGLCRIKREGLCSYIDSYKDLFRPDGTLVERVANYMCPACVRGSGDRESNISVGRPGGLIRRDGTGKKCEAAAAETVTGLQQSSLA